MTRSTRALAALLSVAALGVQFAHALGQTGCVAFSNSSSSSSSLASSSSKPISNAFAVVSKANGAAPIFMSSDDWAGVHRAAADFVNDIEAVTGSCPDIANVTVSGGAAPKSMQGQTPILIGTLGQSSLIQAVLQHTKMDVSSINGTWESFMSMQVSNPLPGVDSAFVIIGSDKRGSIFGMYDLSEQFGQSPWYWWADVPTTTHDELFVDGTGACSHGSPSVQYRGIFFNDEQPALQNWAFEKFTNGTSGIDPLTGSPLNHFFYTKVFELLLRMKANYMWPAQWSSAFAVDDHMNQVLADWFGVVMGSSHEEPMTRSIPVEWNLFGIGPWDYSVNAENIYNFWVNGTERVHEGPYESIFTVGMRGNGDLPASPATGVTLLEKIVSDQRQILSNIYIDTNVASIPQLWALYKEVIGYYEMGMTVPEDICLLWTDDNWGNMVRLPIASERNRTGGAGVYYHVDYVGTPRDYKWIQSSQIAKIWEQMSLAFDRDAKRIWILNVGDLKPYEMDTEFFLTFGYDTSKWDQTNLNSFTVQWAEREFGMPTANATQVADILTTMKRFNARRKPELLNSTTYSLINYRESDMVLEAWANLTAASTAIFNSLPAAKQPAFFQLVHHEVLASATLSKMWIYAGMNNLRAQQARLSTNDYADLVRQMFQMDYSLESQYHSLLDGKWDHMMDQTHVMYYYWQQPMQNTMPMITEVQAQKQALPGPMRLMPEGSFGAWPGDEQFDCAQMYSCPNPTMFIDSFVPFGSRFIDIGAAGPNGFTFKATSNASWLTLTPSSGTIDNNKNKEVRVFATVDWTQLEPNSSAMAVINFKASAPNVTSLNALNTLQIPVMMIANRTDVPSGFTGFVDGDGGVSMEAAHASRNTSVDGLTWTEIPNYGRTLSGVTPMPRTDQNFTAGTGPSLEYDFFAFTAMNDTLNVTTYLTPALNLLGDSEPLAIALQMDDGEPQTVHYIPLAAPGALPNGWDTPDGWVANSAIQVNTTHTGVAPGAHTFKIWMIEPAVVVQKIVINTGNVRPSYLGPPESIRV